MLTCISEPFEYHKASSVPKALELCPSVGTTKRSWSALRLHASITIIVALGVHGRRLLPVKTTATLKKPRHEVTPLHMLFYLKLVRRFWLACATIHGALTSQRGMAG